LFEYLIFSVKLPHVSRLDWAYKNNSLITRVGKLFTPYARKLGMDIKLKAILFYLVGAVVFAALLFIPAGTLDFWQAWLYMTIVLVPAAFVVLYFLKNDPAFLGRRMKMKEKERGQQLIIKLGTPLFLAGFLLPGLDRRFGWSNVPLEAVLAAQAIVFIGYLLIFWVFKINSWAGRTIEVVKGQKLISTGPYSVVRHPMYVGFLAMYLSTPFALGSYVALVPFVLCIPLLVARIRNEEKVLNSKLSGYKEYCKKVKWRLVPNIW